MRDKDELELIRLLARLLGRQLDSVIKMVGLARRPIDPSFWNEEVQRMAPPVGDALGNSAFHAAQEWVARYQVAPRFEALEQSIFKWADDYGFDLVKGINDTNRQLIADALKKFIDDPDMKVRDFRDLLSRPMGYSPYRAQMIGVTETTRAYYQGGKVMADEVRAAGEIAHECPICWPLHGARETSPGSQLWQYPDGGTSGPPPAHPNCRCSIGYEVA